MSKRPDEVRLSQEQGEALIGRIKGSDLSADDQRLLERLIRLYFWLTFTLKETKISLGRLKSALFGKRHRNKETGSDDEPPDSGLAPGSLDVSNNKEKKNQKKSPRRGHGRRGADSYSGAKRVICHHEKLRVGERCSRCGRGKLYSLPAGVEIKVDGHALLSAIRYEREKLRCSGCGEIFTAALPADISDKNTVRAPVPLWP